MNIYYFMTLLLSLVFSITLNCHALLQHHNDINSSRNENFRGQKYTTIAHAQYSHDRKLVDEKLLYYIQTTEGIIAHLRELATLSDIMQIYSRNIVALPFKSHHYPDMSNGVNICDAFVLPLNIQCQSIPHEDILTKYTCYEYIRHNYLFRSHGHHVTTNIKVSSNFSYSDIDCFIGSLNYSIGSYDNNKIKKQPMGIRNFPIKLDYLDHLDFIKAALNIKKDEKFAVVHWRRGDQLTSRCKISFNDAHIDDGINCGSADDFVNKLNENLHKYIPGFDNNFPVYIATNEIDADILLQLKDNNFRLFSDMKESLMDIYTKVTSLDTFLLELMLMVNADYYMAWGKSSIHRYVAGYRNENHFANNTYIYNDQPGYYIYT